MSSLRASQPQAQGQFSTGSETSAAVRCWGEHLLETGRAEVEIQRDVFGVLPGELDAAGEEMFDQSKDIPACGLARPCETTSRGLLAMGPVEFTTCALANPEPDRAWIAVSAERESPPEGRVEISSRTIGRLTCLLRKKQWWSFEGWSDNLYCNFLAMQAFPASYLAMTVIDTERGEQWQVDRLGGFRVDMGDALSLFARGNWGDLRFSGRAASGWKIEANTPRFAAHLTQVIKGQNKRLFSPPRLHTGDIDYSISQAIDNQTTGTLILEDRRGTKTEHAFDGFGYYEHNWGVNPRKSVAHWLHFWGADVSGVVMNCVYNKARHPHYYVYLHCRGREYYLHFPPQFQFDRTADNAHEPWAIAAPGLRLRIWNRFETAERKAIPTGFLPYVKTDYLQALVELEGTFTLPDDPQETISFVGVGKFDDADLTW